MVRNIVFDMGNVLVSYDPEKALKSHEGVKSNKDINDIINAVFNTAEWLMLDRGTITHDQAKVIFKSRLEPRLLPAAFYVMDNWHRNVDPFIEMENLIKTLKGNGYKIYLLSNVSIDYFNFRENLPGIKYFDGEFISSQWGEIKPSEKIFFRFYSHFNLIPGECFFIDDSAPNIESARRTGMDGHIYNDFDSLIKTLDEKNINRK